MVHGSHPHVATAKTLFVPNISNVFAGDVAYTLHTDTLDALDNFPFLELMDFLFNL